MMFSPAKAATKAGVSRKTIMNNIKRLDLPAHRNNQNYWVIRPTDLATWMKAREKRSPQTRSVNTKDTLPSAPILEYELDALKAQLALSFVNQRLEASQHDNEKLKQEVIELKVELKESRGEMNKVWREVTGKLVSLAKPYKRRAPLVLTEDMRVDGGNDDITNLFTD
ncbi:helix-turn-helix domain-containing protein [Amylibacter sp.]|nr:helix-turn-helix domain-containing protein [Amylibacter sp.]